MKNKKKIITIVFMLFASVAFSQSSSLLGKKLINLNVGCSISKYAKTYDFPIFDMGIEYGVHKNITVGTMFLFAPKFEDSRLYSLFLNGDYYFNSLLGIPPSFDLYTGLSLGFVVEVRQPPSFHKFIPKPGREQGIIDTSVHRSPGILLRSGCRYFFNKSWGIGLEYYVNKVVNIGVTYRF